MATLWAYSREGLQLGTNGQYRCQHPLVLYPADLHSDLHLLGRHLYVRTPSRYSNTCRGPLLAFWGLQFTMRRLFERVVERYQVRIRMI